MAKTEMLFKTKETVNIKSIKKALSNGIHKIGCIPRIRKIKNQFYKPSFVGMLEIYKGSLVIQLERRQ